MFERHVGSKLSVYLDGQLAPEEARRVAEHIAHCAKCQQELKEISAGAELAQSLTAAAAPDSLWPSIQRRMSEAPALSPALRTWFAWPRAAVAIGAAALITVGAALAWYFEIRQPLQVTIAGKAPSEFETAAMRAHDSQGRRDWQWDFATHDPRQLRDWLRLASGLHANLPDVRPSEDNGRLQLVGVKLIEAGGARAAVIGYQVDSRQVTLLTARLRDLHQQIGEGFLSKAIVYRAAQGEIKTFTWAASGQAYVMVSELPHFGERGCILCHTQPERRALISHMDPQRKN